VGTRPRIVVIGGGTGTYTALLGLKRHQVNLTAVVSMADDGGSSGRLRDEFGHLPPGDVRRCLLALSSDESARVLRQLFEYRFARGNGLSGHSFGNLILTALTEMTGRTDLAIAEAARLLNVKGTVLPVTLTNSCLCAEIDDGTLIRGECHIDIRTEKPDHRLRRVFLDPPAAANPMVLTAIEKADAIVIGPGDLYTSILPNLLVAGVAEAIRRTSGLRVYVCNLMTKHGETDGFSASEFVLEVQRYLGGSRPLDHVILSDDSQFPTELLQKYAAERSFPVDPDLTRCACLGVQIHCHSLAAAGTLLRHDPAKLALAVMEIVAQRRGHCSRNDSAVPRHGASASRPWGEPYREAWSNESLSSSVGIGPSLPGAGDTAGSLQYRGTAN
jgi:uncharacterized cofD-like protein